MYSKNKLLNSLSGLPNDVKISNYKHVGDNILELFVDWEEPKLDERECPYCKGTYIIKKDSGRSQTLRHTPSGLYNIWLTFHKPRFYCKSCNRTFYITPWWAHTDMSISLPLFYLIYKLLIGTTLNLTEIAKRTNSTPAIVRHVIDKIRLETPLTLPKSIGIDEFHGNTGHYDKPSKKYKTEKYHCVITDTDRSTVFDVIRNPKHKCLHEYFMTYDLSVRRCVRFVSLDMRSGFSKASRECFPNAKICIDPFHVVKLLTEAVSTVRKDEWRHHENVYNQYMETISHLSSQEVKNNPKRKVLEHNCKLIKNSQRVLVASPFNDTYWSQRYIEREDRLEEIFTISPSLKLPYEALSSFYEVENSSSSDRHQLLLDWIKTYTKCDCPPIKQTANSISKRRSAIERAWKYHKSNAKTEGLNKKIKDIKRAGFGMHDFDNFRKRILLSLGTEHVVDEFYAIHKKRAEALCNEAINGGNAHD